jgi:hypothetical protein
MAKKKSTPLATVASDTTGGQDNPGRKTEVYTSTDPSGAPDETTYDAMVPIVCSTIIAYIIKVFKFPDIHQSTGFNGVDSRYYYRIR